MQKCFFALTALLVVIQPAGALACARAFWQLRHQWCGQDHAMNCARAALRNSDASVQEVDRLLGLLSSERLPLDKRSCDDDGECKLCQCHTKIHENSQMVSSMWYKNCRAYLNCACSLSLDSERPRQGNTALSHRSCPLATLHPNSYVRRVRPMSHLVSES